MIILHFFLLQLISSITCQLFQSAILLKMKHTPQESGQVKLVGVKYPGLAVSELPIRSCNVLGISLCTDPFNE